MADLSKSVSSDRHMKQYAPVKDVPQDNKTIQCSICNVLIAYDMVFQNIKYCRHRYCIYCLSDIQDSIHKFHSCFLKVCNQRLDTYGLTKFIDAHKKGSSMSQSMPPQSQPISDPRKSTSSQSSPFYQPGQSSSSQKSSTQSKQPSIYDQVPKSQQNKPQQDGRIIPENKQSQQQPQNQYGGWEQSQPSVNGNTGASTQDTTMMRSNHSSSMKAENEDKSNMSQSLQLQKSMSITNMCQVCRKEKSFDELLQNPKCNHMFCLECLEYNRQRYKDYCPVEKCRFYLSKDILQQAKNLREMQSNSVTSMSALENFSVLCGTCKNKEDIQTPNGVKPTYWKCQTCRKLVCVKHSDHVIKCGCFCYDCSGEYMQNVLKNQKACYKCRLYFCIKCNAPFDTRQNPTCKCDKILEIGGKKMDFSKMNEADKEYSVCQVCNDFTTISIPWNTLQSMCQKHKVVCDFCVEANLQSFKDNSYRNSCGFCAIKDL